MQKLILISALAFLLTACSDSKIVDNPSQDLERNIAVATASVSYPDQVTLGSTVQFKVMLQVGEPCYFFLRFDTETQGREVFVKPIARQKFRGCDTTATPIELPYEWTPSDTGVHLLHFYENEDSDYNFQVRVIE